MLAFGLPCIHSGHRRGGILYIDCVGGAEARRHRCPWCQGKAEGGDNTSKMSPPPVTSLWHEVAVLGEGLIGNPAITTTEYVMRYRLEHTRHALFSLIQIVYGPVFNADLTHSSLKKID